MVCRKVDGLRNPKRNPMKKLLNIVLALAGFALVGVAAQPLAAQ